MPSFQDSAIIFIIALLLFGPKELPKLARWAGKLMNEFRRASNEFRMQMEDEFRQAEQAEHQKKIAALEPPTPIAPTEAPTPEAALSEDAVAEPAFEAASSPELPPDPVAELTPEPVIAESIARTPIATNGDLHMMPPATGLPISRSASPISDIFDSIPHTPSPVEHETTHG